MKRSLRSRSLNGSLQLETLTWNYCQCQIAGGNWAQPSLIVSRKAQRRPEKKWSQPSLILSIFSGQK